MDNTYTIRNIVNEDGSALVSDYGAHVLSWTPKGHEPVVWQPKAVYLSEGTAIRGGVPVIFPWFGLGYENGEPAGKNPRHGFARTAFWHVDRDTLTDRHVLYTLESDEIAPELLAETPSGPDSKFHAEYDVAVSDTLTMTLTVENTGDAPLTFEAAMHTYLHVGDVRCTQISGLVDTPYLDSADDFAPKEQTTSPLAFDGTMVDRIYQSEGTLLVHDEALHRTIMVEKSGSPQTVVWNPGEEAGNKIGDLMEGEWHDFVCVEAVVNRDSAVTIEPGEAYSISQTIRVK
ncbi:D-hexose-6-phosphate mutarotase [Bifidobacterium amazonense]|uniref:Putative glucose-6-phosphate 1-epimerase n=1 Tax=Bifidobacterium amazonense TaxID=2809027 RepID=A0ABS9VSK9_9BIFI|nr:D-hexose-6-phosphate mutarotase [Bifidobacterium amazonense]MCH9275078.1 D-hexose-6-phosphate mutarotase [Bifidobacterium amazonense]